MLLPRSNQAFNLPSWDEYLTKDIPSDLVLGISIADMGDAVILGQHCKANIEYGTHRYMSLLGIVSNLGGALFLVAENEEFNLSYASDKKNAGEWEENGNGYVFYPASLDRRYVDFIFDQYSV